MLTCREILETWIEAVNNRDIDKIIGLYNAKAVLITTFSPHVVSGHEKVLSYFKELFRHDNLNVLLHEKAYREQQITDTLSCISGIYTFQFEVDEILLSFPSRFNFILDHSTPSPIIHHHSSQFPRALY